MRLWGRWLSWNRLEGCVWALLFGVALILGVRFAYYTIFTRFMPYDDEGFILISLKSFFAGKPLYDGIYSCYQPWFYECYRLLFGLTNLELCHDSIRLVTVALWLACAGLNGLLTWRLTGNRLLALGVLIITTRMFKPFANEPGHPQTLAYLLLVALALWFAWGDRLNQRLLAIGAGWLVGMLLLTKINIGLFAVLPTALVLALACESRFARSLRLLVVALMLLAPLVLMRADLVPQAFSPSRIAAVAIGTGAIAYLARRRWAESDIAFGSVFLFALLFLLVSVNKQFGGWLPTVAILNAALVLVGLGRPQLQLGHKDLLAGVTAMLLTLALICGLVHWQGTSLGGLWQGLIMLPMQQSAMYAVPWRCDGLAVCGSFAGLVVCGGYLLARQRCGAAGWLEWSAAGFKLLFGLGTLLAFVVSVPILTRPHFWMLPFCWVLLIAPAPGASVLARCALLGLAVMQSLVAFPIAGSQLVSATALVVVVGAVCSSDALLFFSSRAPAPARMRCCRPVAALACSICCLLLFFSDTAALANRYATLTPLGLPGATRIRLPRPEAARLQAITARLALPEVGTFLTMPGLNSLYFWTRKAPPTDWNVTAWMILIDPAGQEAIWAAAQKHPGLLAVRNREVTDIWMQGRSTDGLPLVRHLDEDFTTITNIDGYEVLTLRLKPRLSQL